MVEEGATVRDLLPDGWSSEDGHTLVFVNVDRCDDWDRVVHEGEVVHFFGGVTSPIHFVMIALAVISAIVAIRLAPSIPETSVATNPDGGSAYGYYGFQNSFRAEGDPVPVVYGRVRVAPPVINQVIAGNTISQQLSIALREDMYVLLAISEGPIQGIGRYGGVVENQADQDALSGNVGGTKVGSGLQINGIGGANFIGFINWRTGTLNQEPFIGSAGYVNYNDTAATYQIGLTPLLGQEADQTSDTAYPAGVYAAGSTDLLSNSIATEFVEQDLLGQKVDRAIVQILFEQGLYATGPSAKGKNIRIQYRETDSSGTGTGSYVLLPNFRVISSQTIPVVFDIPVDFVDPATYVPSAAGGYFYTNPTADDYIALASSAGQGLIRPTNGSVAAQSWTWGCWVALKDSIYANYLFGQSSYTLPLAGGDISWRKASQNNPFTAPNETSISTTDRGFQISLTQDRENTLGLGGDQMILRLDMWMNGIDDQFGVWMAPVGALNTSWNLASTPENNWTHVAVIYDGVTAGGPTCTVVLDGSSYIPMTFTIVGVGSGTAAEFYPFWNSGGRTTIGCFQRYLSGAGVEFAQEAFLSEMFLLDYVIDSATLTLLGNSGLGVDVFGHKQSGVRDVFETDPNALIVMPMVNGEAVGSDDLYRNYVDNATGTATQADGSFYLQPLSAARTIHGPVWTTTGGTPKKSYWQMEVYVSTQSSGSGYQNAATIDTIVALSSQPYSYPSTALASVNVEADDQINNQQPAITILVDGRIVDTWDGSTDANGDPALTQAWSRNPAWIAADLLTNERYGLGGELSSDSIDWPSFLSWAQFCDEGVPDAFGNVDIFGLLVEGDAVHAAEQILTIYVGINDTAGGVALPEQVLPESWRGRDPVTGDSIAFVSLSAVTSGGISSEWVTSSDHPVGLNEASNQLGIYSIKYLDSPLQGYDIYAEVKLRWNRLDAVGAAIWPSGITQGDTEYIGDHGALTTLATTSGYESRCRFDGVFDQKNVSAWTAVLQIFTAGRAMPIKAGRSIIAVVDRPRPVVGVFGQGNIIDGSLELTYKGPKQQPNSVEGDILDQHANYERRMISVDHPSVQDPTLFDAFRKERVDFRGVTRASQAMRDATYRLNRYNLVRRFAEFSVGPDAVNLLPGDRIRVSHDVPQYGYSGRLRADSVRINSFPNGGDLYASWDLQGGPNSLGNALLRSDSSLTPPVLSTYAAAELFSLPMTADATEPASAQGQDGSDASGSLAPGWVGQIVATGSQLYPPNSSISPLAQITSASYKCAFSVYVKEPALGASDVIRINVYRLVDSTGTPIDTSYVGDFTWGSGAITSTHTSTGITAAVSSIGSGWYRISVIYSNAAASGDIGDYLQARAYIGTNSGGGDDGTFFTVAAGGRGTNFLLWGDPLDCTNAAWTRYNSGTSSVLIDNVVFAPPFYTATDGTYGQVAKLYKPGGIANGTTPPNLVQTHTLTTGSGVGSWSGQVITVTGYARVGPANGANNTSLYIDLRYAATVDGENKLSGDGGRATLATPASGSWAVSGTSQTAASGTVNSIAATVAAVRQTSSANDANWAQFTLSVAYTPSSGVPTAISVGVFTDSGGTASGGDTEMYVWGLRVSGQSSTNVSLNNYYHRKGVFTSAQFEDGSTSVSAFATGSTIQLDRPVDLTVGNTYEVLLRSSFAPDAVQNADNSQVVLVDATEVPASGTTTKAANVALKIDTPAKFDGHEGDLYSFGKQGAASEDFVINRISMDPMTLERIIECEEYNAAIYVDTAFGTTGTDTISDLPAPSAAANSSANSGLGSPTNSSIGGRSLNVILVDESMSDEGGNFVPRVGVRWLWPKGVPVPKDVRVYFEVDTRFTADAQAAREAPIQIGTAPTREGYLSYSSSLLSRGVKYRFYVQPVGNRVGTTPIRACMSDAIIIRKSADLSALAPPVLTTATRGWEQMYYLDPVTTARTAEVVEGRIGGWKLGSAAFIIDPDTGNTASDSTLVGQASTRFGVTGMQVFCRSRTAQGHYGQATVLQGTEQLVDVLYDFSTEASNGYSGAGAISTEMDVGSEGDLKFKASSSAVTAAYTPDQISLGTLPLRVLVNCVPEAIQIRPETLADLPYLLGGEKLRRWTFEGSMDDMDGEEAEILVEWRWSSTASASGVAWRVFRPGEVYARVIDFRITFNRPTDDYNIRMQRLVVQALLPPNFSPATVDGGAF